MPNIRESHLRTPYLQMLPLDIACHLANADSQGYLVFQQREITQKGMVSSKGCLLRGSIKSFNKWRSVRVGVKFLNCVSGCKVFQVKEIFYSGCKVIQVKEISYSGCKVFYVREISYSGYKVFQVREIGFQDFQHQRIAWSIGRSLRGVKSYIKGRSLRMDVKSFIKGSTAERKELSLLSITMV